MENSSPAESAELQEMLLYLHPYRTGETFNCMSKSSIMTLRLPTEVRRGVERLAARAGHKPAQMGARLLEEALRRRDYPQIDLRETAAGRVAYLAGTRLAVHWVAQRIRDAKGLDRFARDYDLPIARVRAALAYAQSFPAEMERDLEEAEANRSWIEAQDTAWRMDRPGGRSDRKSKR